MRTAIVSFLLILAGCTQNNSPGESSSSAGKHRPDNAITLLNSAIISHGADAVEKLQAGKIQIDVRSYSQGKPQDQNLQTWLFKAPDKLKVTAEVILPDETVTMTYLRNADRAWNSIDDGPFTPSEDLRSLHDLNQIRIIDEMKVLCDKSFEKTLDNNILVDGREYYVMRITRDGQFVAESHFEKSTNLLAKITTNTVNPQTGKNAKSESYYSDYKDYGGLMLASEIKEYFDGEIFSQKSLKGLELLDSVDDAQFSVPSD